MNTIDANYEEVLLLPPSIEDWVPAEHPARFIREFVEQLDLSGLDFVDVSLNSTGRPAYSTALLLRVWLMGYWRGIRSTRKLEQACRETMPFLWLCGRCVPDHSTLWRFFRQNRKGLRRLFKQTVVLAKEMDLVDFVVQALDGTKIQSACSGYMKADRKSLEKLLEGVDKRIAELEKQISFSEHQRRTSDAQLPSELSNRRALREKVAKALEKINSGETKHCNPMEREARRMECNTNNRFGYNAQAVVDGKNQVVVAADVTNENTDSGMLHEMASQAHANTGETAEVTVADAGYASGDQIQKAEEDGYRVLVAQQEQPQQRPDDKYSRWNFVYDEQRDVVICPEGQELKFRRERMKGRIRTRSYRSTGVCNRCHAREKCSRSRDGRDIQVYPGRRYTDAMSKRLRSEENQRLMRKRAGIVEPVFAQIKWNWGLRRLQTYGLQNAKAVWDLTCAVYNMRKLRLAWA
jgi:transposase